MRVGPGDMCGVPCVCVCGVCVECVCGVCVCVCVWCALCVCVCIIYRIAGNFVGANFRTNYPF